MLLVPSRRSIVAISVLLAVGGGALLVAWALRPSHVRERVISAVNERFDGRVEATAIAISVLPSPMITGTGLTVRLRDHTDLPPLITVASFTASAPLRGLIGRQLHLSRVQLEGQDIRVPPGGLRRGVNPPGADEHTPHAEAPSPILIDEIVSRDARLEIASGRPNKLPRVFEIHDLVMHGFGLPEGARFEAGVTNPVPSGRVETSGTFGPWHTDAPRLTPIRGDYAFRNADLDDIRGISGILSSVGQYRGTLERIEVDGQTETPDFSIDLAGQPVSLSTRFKAIVDGTNGDTWLDHVDARLSDSSIVASGAVVRDRDVKGRHVELDVAIDQARLEDLMRLAVKADKPPMTGRVDVTTRLLLPAGSEDVIDRLNLDGRFSVAEARFSNVNVQRRIASLSLRARGDEDAQPEDNGASVVSNLRGRFVMRHAQLDFTELRFTIPGAEVRLAGTYNLRRELLDFQGDLLVDATLADMTSGFKSLLARLAQPFFRRPGGGSQVPIRISGPRSKPQFRVDVRRIFR